MALDEAGTSLSGSQANTLRILSVSASCVSIVAGLIAFYLYISMRTKVFRHHLILLLLMFDFGKAVVLLWYPARVLLVPSAYDNVNFCEVVGFFTSTFIEGADIAILALAIHTALLIFKKYTGTEGGLYKYRYYVYAINFLLPLVMASLAFVDNGRFSYTPLITWCYLPIHPVWFRLVLSWIPRYLVLTSILAIYLSIYIYVKLEYRKVVKAYSQSQTYINTSEKTHVSIFSRVINMFRSSPSPENTSPREPFSAKKLMVGIVSPVCRFLSNFPGLSCLEPSRLFEDAAANPNDLDMAIRSFQKDTMANFQARRSMIERQIQTIFLYPIAYLFLWAAPFAAHMIQYKQDLKHTTVFWISCAASFMQPFNCTVDTLVFCIRERPWVDREERIFTRSNAEWIKSHLWRLIFCASNEHRRKSVSESNPSITPQDNSTFEINNTQSKDNAYDPSSLNQFSSFDADIERFASKNQITSQVRKPSKLMLAVLSSKTDSSEDTWAVSRATPMSNTPSHKLSMSHTFTTLRQQDDLFTFSEHHDEHGDQHSEDQTSDDGSGEIDLLEFLR